MNNIQVEGKAVRVVQDAIENSARLKTYISENDRTPSWDGEVIVYRDSSLGKDKIIGRVPVQVKGKACDDHTKSQISFSMDIADLENYKNNGGCFLFVVYIAEDFQKTKIYYSALAPIELRRLLRDTKEGQKEKCVKLQEFPSQKEKIFSIFSFCVKNFEKQASFARDDAYLSFSDVDDLSKKGLAEGVQFSVECSSSERNDPVGAWLNNKSHMYLKTKGCKILQPVALSSEQVSYKAATTGKIFMISIDDKIYGGGNVIRGKGRENNEKTVFPFLDGIVLEVDEIRKGMRPPKLGFQLNMPERIYMVVYQLEFLLAAVKKGYFSVIIINVNDKKCFEIKPSVSAPDDYIKMVEGALRRYKKVEELFEMLHCADDANINDFKGEDWEKLNILMLGLLDKKPVKVDLKDDSKKDLRYIRIYYEVGKLKFLIGLEKCSEKGEYKIYDFFSPDFQLPSYVFDGKCPETIFPISHFVQLQKNDFLTLSNIDFGGLIKDLKDTPFNLATFSLITENFWLRLLGAYDKAEGPRKDKLLEVCKKLVDWIENMPDDDIDEQNKLVKTLNVFQTVKRYREFTAEERKSLWSIAIGAEKQKTAQVGAYWLLDQQELAKEEFEKLSKEDQEILKNAPIFHFCKWK